MKFSTVVGRKEGARSEDNDIAVSSPATTVVLNKTQTKKTHSDQIKDRLNLKRMLATKDFINKPPTFAQAPTAETVAVTISKAAWGAD